MRRRSAITIMALGAAVIASNAEAKLDLFVDKSTQQISVIQNGRLLYVWPISTGRDRFSTPSGVYAPERLEPMWFSKVYYDTPMPHAIFFHHGYAIHGSYDIARLGGPASHGCIRLHPQDAALLFGMVAQEGPGNTVIVIGGGGSPNPVSARYGDLDGALRLPYRHDAGSVPGPYPPGPNVYPPSPGMRPYDYGDRYNADPFVEGPPQRRGDNGRFAAKAPSPTSRPPAPRLDAQALVDPAPSLRGSYRPQGAAPANARSKCPTCAPNRAPNDTTNRHVSATESARPLPPVYLSPLSPAASSAPPLAPAASSPPPSPPAASPPAAPSPSEQQQPTFGYKVLPRSYWAGAAWRWRLKAEHEITSAPSPTPDSQ